MNDYNDFLRKKKFISNKLLFNKMIKMYSFYSKNRFKTSLISNSLYLNLNNSANMANVLEPLLNSKNILLYNNRIFHHFLYS
jgi:hypothetical protein